MENWWTFGKIFRFCYSLAGLLLFKLKHIKVGFTWRTNHLMVSAIFLPLLNYLDCATPHQVEKVQPEYLINESTRPVIASGVESWLNFIHFVPRILESSLPNQWSGRRIPLTMIRFRMKTELISYSLRASENHSSYSTICCVAQRRRRCPLKNYQ